MEFSGRIHEEAARLKELVEGILHLSKLEEKRDQPFVPVDLRMQAEAAMKHLQPQAAARGVQVTINGSVQVAGVPWTTASV